MQKFYQSQTLILALCAVSRSENFQQGPNRASVENCPWLTAESIHEGEGTSIL